METRYVTMETLTIWYCACLAYSWIVVAPPRPLQSLLSLCPRAGGSGGQKPVQSSLFAHHCITCQCMRIRTGALQRMPPCVVDGRRILPLLPPAQAIKPLPRELLHQESGLEAEAPPDGFEVVTVMDKAAMRAGQGLSVGVAVGFQGGRGIAVMDGQIQLGKIAGKLRGEMQKVAVATVRPTAKPTKRPTPTKKEYKKLRKLRKIADRNVPSPSGRRMVYRAPWPDLANPRDAVEGAGGLGGLGWVGTGPHIDRDCRPTRPSLHDTGPKSWLSGCKAERTRTAPMDHRAGDTIMVPVCVCVCVWAWVGCVCPVLRGGKAGGA